MIQTGELRTFPPQKWRQRHWEGAQAENGSLFWSKLPYFWLKFHTIILMYSIFLFFFLPSNFFGVFFRKWIWESPQLSRSAGLSRWHEQEHAGEVSSSHELRHEQPQTWPTRAHPSWCQEQHALHREWSLHPSSHVIIPPSPHPHLPTVYLPIYGEAGLSV